MHTVVFGYGKIGRIKADFWKSLGRTVAIVDPKFRNGHKLPRGFSSIKLAEYSNDLIVDIATPASQHIPALVDAHRRFGDKIRLAIVEKPLVSDKKESDMLRDFIRKNPGMKSKIVVNESYFSSSALEFVKDRIIANGETINEIKGVLNKNRLVDNKNGRFFDANLAGLGIEIPHLVSIVEKLSDIKLDTDDFRAEIIRSPEDWKNQVVRMDGVAGHVSITMCSALGDFNIEEDDTVTPNSMKRIVRVATDQSDYVIEFDPAPGLDRYHARVSVAHSGFSEPEVHIIEDNHLFAQLSILTSDRQEDLIPYIGLDNSRRIANILLSQREKAVTRTLVSEAGARRAEYAVVA